MYQGYDQGLDLNEAREARGRGRWILRLLDVAAAKLAERLGRRVYDDWSHAYFLYVEGFCGAGLFIDQVRARARYVEELLEIARNTIAKTRETNTNHNEMLRSKRVCSGTTVMERGEC